MHNPECNSYENGVDPDLLISEEMTSPPVQIERSDSQEMEG